MKKIKIGNKFNKAKYSFISSNKKIVKVNKKGIILARKNGKTIVFVKKQKKKIAKFIVRVKGTNSNAQTKEQLRTYIEQSETYLNAGNYIEAIAILDAAKQLLGAHPDIKSQRNKIVKKQLLSSVSDFEKTQDYASAIKAIEKTGTKFQKDAEVVQKLNSLKIIYRSKVIADADTVFKQAGYSEAIKIINKGLTVLLNDSMLLAKINEYNEYKPVKLSALKRVDDNWRVYDDWNGSDSKGNSINDAWLILTYSDPQTAEIYVGRKYSTMTFDIMPSSSFSTNELISSTVKIYADDVLVYTSPNINYKSSAIHANVNINNAEYIRIEGKGTKSDENAYTILNDVYVSK